MLNKYLVNLLVAIYCPDLNHLDLFIQEITQSFNLKRETVLAEIFHVCAAVNQKISSKQTLLFEVRLVRMAKRKSKKITAHKKRLWYEISRHDRT